MVTNMMDSSRSQINRYIKLIFFPRETFEFIREHHRARNAIQFEHNLQYLCLINGIMILHVLSILRCFYLYLLDSKIGLNERIGWCDFLFFIGYPGIGSIFHSFIFMMLIQFYYVLYYLDTKIYHLFFKVIFQQQTDMFVSIVHFDGTPIYIVVRRNAQKLFYSFRFVYYNACK